MFIVKNRKIFYIISICLVVISLVALALWGIKPGLDFTGGSEMQFVYEGARPELAQVKAKIDGIKFDPEIKGDYQLRQAGENGFNLKLRSVTEAERVSIQNAISFDTFKAEIKKFNSIGPVLGKEASIKSIWAVVLVLLAIILFISFAFRKVSEPVSSWKYGLFAVVALFHDVFIPIGLFSILGHYLGYEIDTLFVTAILVVLGFSVHDTIVVFDRVRENLKLNRIVREPKNFETIVGNSISQTVVRSINTSLTTLLAVVCLYFFGPETTKNFALVLIVGIFFGTYSSIFIASNLLVTAEKWKKGV